MRRRAAGLTLVAGLTIMALAQLAAPLGSPPLYDGVVVQDPYRYVAPQSGQAGAPSSYTRSQPVQGSTSPAFAASTTENPPQAQLVASEGAFVIAPAMTSLDVSIEPVVAPPPPPQGPVAGNLYRFAVTDPTGTATPIGPATPPSIVLRAPDGVLDAQIARYQGGAWQELPTQASGQPGIFVAIVDSLGEFALIAQPSSGPLGLDPAFLAIGAGATLAVAFFGLYLIRNRARRTPEPVAHSRAARPSKRRRNRRRGRR